MAVSTLWLLPSFVAGCAVIDMAQRWASAITLALTVTCATLAMILILALSNPDRPVPTSSIYEAPHIEASGMD